MKTRTLAAGLVVAGALAGSFAPSSARAQGLLDVGRFLLGLPAEEKPPIDYRERAPIVVPPSTNLRPPAEGGAPDQRRANWPTDPEVVARRRAAADAGKPVMVDAVTGEDIGGPVRRMSPAQIREGRVAGQEIGGVAQRPRWDDKDFHNVMGGVSTLRQMDSKMATASSSDNLDRTEPKREFLTDPPTGLRRPADNAAFKATREGEFGTRKDPHPLDIFKDGPNTR
jgi:hypothetical protein